jgi:hypothetical protein
VRRLFVSVLGAALVLALAAGAAGKAPPTGIEICGQEGCKTIAAADAERVVISLYGSDAQPAAPASFFILRWQWPNAPEQKAWWVPKSGLVRGLDGRWASQSVASEAVLGRAAAGIRPLAAPTLTRVVVGKRVAENPQSYLRLLRGGELASTFDGAGWIDVRLASVEPSPWTNGASWVRVSRKGGWVWRDVWVYRVPQTLAERVRQGLSLTPFVRGA